MRGVGIGSSGFELDVRIESESNLVVVFVDAAVEVAHEWNEAVAPICLSMMLIGGN
jgi:hypothetical protein